MLKHYLKIAFRNILKQKTTSFINIIGLAVGMASCVLILFYVSYELSYDNFHEKGDRIYRLIAERKAASGTISDAVTPPLLAPALTNDFPEIKSSVRFLNIDNPSPLISFGSKHFYEKQLFFTDPSLFDLFTIPLIKGSTKTALKEPNSVVITETIADKYFGSEEPIGKTLRLNNRIDLQITGVIKDLPSNSTLNMDFIISFSTLYGWLGKDFVESWQNNMCWTYVLLNGNTASVNIQKRFPGFINKHVDRSNSLKNIYLQPLNRIHLYSQTDYNIASDGHIRNIYILIAIAFIILLISCFNYISLSTAKIIQRSKEIGVRKLLGATRQELHFQFLAEGFIFAIIALVIAFLFVWVSLPYLTDITGKDFSINFSNHWKSIILPALFVLLFGFISGGFPSFFLSSFQPANLVKTQHGSGTGKMSFRKVLVVIQFALTNILIIGSWVIYNQLNYMQNKNLGFDGDQVIVVPIRDEGLRQNHDELKNELLGIQGVKEIGAAALLPGGPVGKTRYKVEELSETGTMLMLWIDHDFIKTLGIELIAGRDFSKDFSTDASEAFIINEEAVKKLGFQNPIDAIGKSFELTGSKKGNIIGVVKDFHFTSLQNKIEPLVLHVWPWLNYLLIRTNGEHLSQIIDNIKEKWNTIDPANPFEFNFLSGNFEKYYRKDQQLEKVSTLFTAIALLIACMGLFSLSAYSLERKTKEIGIRKVLGASIAGILGAQLKEFIVLIIIAMIIAFPIGFYVMTNWLQNYAYHIGIDIKTIFLTGLISLTTAIITVSYHAVKAALANPVESLRYE